MQQPITVDDQPISATFFGEGRWLTDFITPDALEVQELYSQITEGVSSFEDRMEALHKWVASEVQYKKFIKGKIWVEGRVSVQDDLWNSPSVTKRIKVGNCANKSFLLASLLRNELPTDKVFCVLGNLYNGKPGGHAWVQVNLSGNDYIMESTRMDVPALIPTQTTERYEAVHLFNDKSVQAIEGRTVMEPMTACFSTWLSDYLNWAYINRQRGRA